MATPGPLDTVAYIAVRLYGDDSMSVSGNIGDVKLALSMLDHARDAVRAQLRTRTAEGLLLPPSSVEVAPNPAFPLVQYGDVAPGLRPRTGTGV